MSEDVEEKGVQQDLGDEAATGRRWRLSLAMIALGVVLVGGGVVFDKNVLLWGGLLIILAFGMVAAGATRAGIGLKGFFAGFKLPRNLRVRTRRVKKTGLEPHGRSPADPSNGKGETPVQVPKNPERAPDRQNSEEP